MTYEFRLPDIGEGVVEGEVVRWLVKEGDPVKEDQPMVEVMTDKATVEIGAPRAGRVAKRMFAEGERCPVGKVLIVLETEGGVEAPAKAHGAPAASEPAQAAAPATNGAPAASGGAVLATPATRKLARDLSVDIRTVVGTGRAGRVTSDDVKAHGPGAAPAAAPAARDLRQGEGTRIPFRGMRRKIAETLARSKFTAPHATYVEEIDCTELVALRARLNAKLAPTGTKLSFLPLIIKATVGALKKYPQMNAMLDEKASEIIQWQRLHIGLATATENGLVVPVIRDADHKSLTELARDIERLADATRTGKATREDLVGSTFTITSLGAWGGVMATAIINPPEVAILGVHRIARRPAVVGDKIEIRELMNLSLSFDHRVLDGLDAAQFVGEIKRALEAPAPLGAQLGAHLGAEER
ncbi:MAG TPA: dihydrolipoamide acetyltransferase family protein [Polyangia bacterium]|nr:dihydrolipoamide acetyltransferase family protein [Polyangia bacterium]